MNKYFFLTCWWLWNTVQAEIITDGTLGMPGPLSGPNFTIDANLGQQQGSNLFHSFSQFNLYQGETATFTGSNEVTNIISRVTGGGTSTIDGTLRSTIPHANLYLLNPAGIIFGATAKLDLSGGFHASTADTLRLGKDGQFNARQPEQSILTVAPPSAFGFLTDRPSTIIINGSQLITSSQDLSLIAGNLAITGKIQVNDKGETLLNPLKQPLHTSQVGTQGGQLTIVSVASAGEVTPTAAGIALSEGMRGGQIRAEKVTLTSSGLGGGDIFIRSERFELINGRIESNTLSEQPAGDIDIEAEQLSLRGAENFTALNADTFNSGQGGNIKIKANHLELKEGAWISSNTYSKGNAGTIRIQVADTFDFTGEWLTELGYPSLISSTAFAANTGNGGRIDITARRMNLTDGAQIGSGTFGIGKAGVITVKVNDTLTLSGRDKVGGYATGIFVSSIGQGEQAGDAGRIEITAGQMFVLDGARVSAGTSGKGKGGALEVKVAGYLTIAGANVMSDQLGVSSSGIASGSFSAKPDAGRAGDLYIQAYAVNIKEDGEISTSTAAAGGGNVIIESPYLFYLQNGQLTTSVKGGSGDGGNITVSAPRFIVMNDSQIKAQADAGDGGNISLISDEFVRSPSSIVSASSRLGVDGRIFIKATEADIARLLHLSNYEKIDARKLLDVACHSKDKGNEFYIFALEALPWRADDVVESSFLGPYFVTSPDDEKASESSPLQAALRLPLWQIACARRDES